MVRWKKGIFQDDSFLYIARLLAIVVTERMSFVRERFFGVILCKKKSSFFPRVSWKEERLIEVHQLCQGNFEGFWKDLGSGGR